MIPGSQCSSLLMYELKAAVKAPAIAADDGSYSGVSPGGVVIDAGEARIEPAGRPLLAAQQFLLEALGAHAEVGLLDVVLGEPGVAVQLRGDAVALVVAQLVPLGERRW